MSTEVAYGVASKEVNIEADGRKQVVLPTTNFGAGRTSMSRLDNNSYRTWLPLTALAKFGSSKAVTLTQRRKYGKFALVLDQ